MRAVHTFGAILVLNRSRTLAYTIASLAGCVVRLAGRTHLCLRLSNTLVLRTRCGDAVLHAHTARSQSNLSLYARAESGQQPVRKLISAQHRIDRIYQYLWLIDAGLPRGARVGVAGTGIRGAHAVHVVVAEGTGRTQLVVDWRWRTVGAIVGVGVAGVSRRGDDALLLTVAGNTEAPAVRAAFSVGRARICFRTLQQPDRAGNGDRKDQEQECAHSCPENELRSETEMNEVEESLELHFWQTAKICLHSSLEYSGVIEVSYFCCAS